MSILGGLGLRKVVVDGFVPFNVPKEGRVRTLYCDVKNLVTIAVGNLVDPVALAKALPLLRADGSRATPEEIADEWWLLKGKSCGEYGNPRKCFREAKGLDVCLAHQGWTYAAPYTRLHLSDQAIGNLVAAKLTEMWRDLLAYFPEAHAWPADAQLALLSMAWGLGQHFSRFYPRFTAAARRQDFVACAAECSMEEADNPGVAPRNKANRILFGNAARVLAEALDPDVLLYPADLGARVRIAEPKVRVATVDEPTHFGDALNDDELAGFLEEDGGMARRRMLSDVMADIARYEITRRNGG